MKSRESDRELFVVVGCGIAGLRCAVELARVGKVHILTKQPTLGQVSKYANGLIACASTDEEDLRLHYQDTLCAGEGLCNPKAVEVLVEEGPEQVQQLIRWGASFHRETGKAVLAEGGAQSRPYICRAADGSTTSEIQRVLLEQVKRNKKITYETDVQIVDILAREGRAAGIEYVDRKKGQRRRLAARAIVLATGGLGQIYPETTNAETATGDGVAIAFRAGAEISDMEFIQFHPTILFIPKAPRLLLPEALRGEGAYLRNIDLQRFMHRYHPQGDLAPRDAVSRAIITEMIRSRSPHVYLDCTDIPEDLVQKKFSRIYQTCLEFGLDLTNDLIPVHPAAHYSIGGVRIDLFGRTSIPNLYATGEVCCSGVHGSNRLPSNSLLESLVFGARVGRGVIDDSKHPTSAKLNGASPKQAAHGKPLKHGSEITRRVKSMMWKDVGVIRSAQSLREALNAFEAFAAEFKASVHDPADLEIYNQWTVAKLVTRSALAREESRGAHYRQDYPLKKDAQFLKHTVISQNWSLRFAS